MKFKEVILKNEKAGAFRKNELLVKKKLREIVFKYPQKFTELLHKTGVPLSFVLPKPIIFAVLLKHLQSNALLRESTSKLLLEFEGENTTNADGQGLAITGGIMSALGSVLSGIGRSQNYATDSNMELQAEKMRMQQQMEEDRRRSRRNTFIVLGISAVVIIGAIAYFKSKAVVDPTKAVAA